MSQTQILAVDTSRAVYSTLRLVQSLILLTLALIAPARVFATGVPQITSQPASVTVAAGANLTLSVAATSDTALTYQWRKGGFPIDGATSATLTLLNVQPADAGGYYVVVS